MKTRFQFDATIELNEVELEAVVSGTVTPGSPMVWRTRNGDGDPGSDPEIDEMDVTVDNVSVYDSLTPGQIESLEEKVWDNLPEPDYHEADEEDDRCEDRE